MPDFTSSVAALRRWSNFDAESPLPGDFSAWKQKNPQAWMKLASNDPELESLLSGRANAGLVADAIQGKLSPIAKTPEERATDQKKAEVKQLIENNPYKSGNFTEKLKLEALDPAAAKELRRQSSYQSPAERQEAAEQAQAQHESALNQMVAAGQARQLQQQMAQSQFTNGLS